MSWAIATPHASWCSKRVSCSHARLSPARSHCAWLAGWKRELRLVVDLSGARPVVTDELTAREQAVLGLLPTGLSAREIADELCISRDTVKTHTKRIYQKLGVSSRPSAVARGRELGLL